MARRRQWSGDDGDGGGEEHLVVSDEDAAFCLGKGGATKDKIANVAGCEIDLMRRGSDQAFVFRGGTSLQRMRGKKYVTFLTRQRGKERVCITDDDADNDLSILVVPSECCGYVTGSRGAYLRSVEDEFHTIMFFCQYSGKRMKPGADRHGEALAIFGDKRARRGAMHRIQSTVEIKRAGTYTSRMKEVENWDNDFDTTVIRLKTDEVSWAKGKNGATRKKIGAAAGCILEYVGSWAHFVGTREQREKAMEYLHWTLQQIDTHHFSPNIRGRDDVSVVDVPSEVVGYLTGAKRATLSRLEEEFGVVMLFFSLGPKGRNAGKTERLGIFGMQRNRRGAELMVWSVVDGKVPGRFSDDLRSDRDPEPWGTDYFEMEPVELSYALGKEGATRKKLQSASGCIIQFVGYFACFAGTMLERKRARQYLAWLLEQRKGQVRVKRRKAEEYGVTQLPIDQEFVQELLGRAAAMLRDIESTTKTHCFLGNNEEDVENLYICSHDPRMRKKAEFMFQKEMRMAGGRGRDNDRPPRMIRDRPHDTGPPRYTATTRDREGDDGGSWPAKRPRRAADRSVDRSASPAGSLSRRGGSTPPRARGGGGGGGASASRSRSAGSASGSARDRGSSAA